MYRFAIFQRSTPTRQLLVLIITWLILLLVSMAFTRLVGKMVWGLDLMEFQVIQDVENPVHLAFLRFIQVTSQLATLVLPPVVLSLLISRTPMRWLTLRRGVAWPSLIIGILLILVALPAIDLLGRWNMSVKLPESMAVISNWMEATEHSTTILTEAFISQTSPWHLFSNLIMIGLLAAIGEELLFRAALIRILSSMFGKARAGIHLAVILSALLFAALHLQFFTFLPRFVLGLMLGYLFVWSGSVWLPILAHFTNNAIAVIAYYLYNTGATTYDPSFMGQTESSFTYIISFLGMGLMMTYVYFRGRFSGWQEWKAELLGRENDE